MVSRILRQTLEEMNPQFPPPKPTWMGSWWSSRIGLQGQPMTTEEHEAEVIEEPARQVDLRNPQATQVVDAAKPRSRSLEDLTTAVQKGPPLGSHARLPLLESLV